MLFLSLPSVVFEEHIQLTFKSSHHEIFCNYQNANFSQTLEVERDRISVEIKNIKLFYRLLYHKITKNRDYLKDLKNNQLEHLARDLYYKSNSLKSYFLNISAYLRDNITYSEAPYPQDAASVIRNKKANCIGFSNLVSHLLKAVGIDNKFIKGFYLEKVWYWGS